MSPSTADQQSSDVGNQSLQFVYLEMEIVEGLTSHSSLHRSIVTIYVGPKQYPFYLHKGRLCQHCSYFEKAFHGSFEEATTGSMYLEDDGVEEFKVFEEWLYSHELGDLEASADPSLLLVRVFCFADRVGISDLQNATLDAIRDRATGQYTSSATSSRTDDMSQHYKPQRDQPPPIPLSIWSLQALSPEPEKSDVKYLPPATSTAIQYAYQNTHERSSLRRLLADIFAFNMKNETLKMDLLALPKEFLADVLVINMKRLPLRLGNEKADFDTQMENYHVHETRPDRRNRVSQAGSGDEPARAAGGDDEVNSCGALDAVKPSRRKKKGKGHL